MQGTAQHPGVVRMPARQYVEKAPRAKIATSSERMGVAFIPFVWLVHDPNTNR